MEVVVSNWWEKGEKVKYGGSEGGEGLTWVAGIAIISGMFAFDNSVILEFVFYAIFEVIACFGFDKTFKVVPIVCDVP